MTTAIDDADGFAVLVVDDEPDIRELLGITLERMDIDVCACADIAAAKAQLTRREFQLCLTDMRLPDGVGLELVREVAQGRYGEAFPIAVITAYGSGEIGFQAAKEGAYDYIPKPFSATHLQILVGRAAHAVMVARESSENGGKESAF